MSRISDSDDPRVLVSTGWLAEHLRAPDLRIIDATWFLEPGRDAHAEYQARHIPGARFFDLDAISDARSALPHMAPPPEVFVSRVRAMGIGDGHQVVMTGRDRSTPAPSKAARRSATGFSVPSAA